MALTERDKPAYQFLKQFKIARLEQINRVAYDNYQVCCNRMRILAKDKLIYKKNDPYKQGLLYGYGPIRSLRNYHHYMIVNETYLLFLEHTTIYEVLVEKPLKNIQPDMVIAGEYQGEPYLYMVEVETDLNGSLIDYDKYNHFLISEWREFFEVKPTVLYVTNKRVQEHKITFNYKVMDTEGNNFIEMLKGPYK